MIKLNGDVPRDSDESASASSSAGAGPSAGLATQAEAHRRGVPGCETPAADEASSGETLRVAEDAQPVCRIRPSRMRRAKARFKLFRRGKLGQTLELYYTIMIRPFYRFYTDGTSTYAGNAAFFSFLAFFPFLIFVAALASFIREDAAISQFLTDIFNPVPGLASNAILPIVKDVIGKNSSSLLTFGMLGTLWVSSSSVEAIRVGLNRAYRVRDMRNYFYHRAKGLLVVVVVAATLLFYATFIVLLPAILEFLRLEDEVRGQMMAYKNAGRALVPFIMIGSSMVLHKFLARITYRWIEILPGAILTYVLGSALVYAFTAYVRSASGFNVIYGSLGGVIVMLLFIYLNAIVFLLGAEFNAVIRDEVRGSYSRDKKE